jgi:polyhydroxyalkanoate synthesis repressor PhaR
MLVKKYGNRRLYDTEDSRYVRLGELADKIRRGSDVRVVDATTGADLTSETLVQIIFEDRHAARLLPAALLMQMIRMGDDALAEFLGRYVTWALEVYVQAKQGLGALAPFTPFSSFLPFGAMARPGPARREAAEPAPAPRDDDIAALRRELDELKKSLRPRKR